MCLMVSELGYWVLQIICPHERGCVLFIYLLICFYLHVTLLVTYLMYVSRFVSFSVFHYSRSFASPYKFWNQPVFFPAKHAGKFLIGALHQFRGELTTF